MQIFNVSLLVTPYYAPTGQQRDDRGHAMNAARERA